MTIGTAILLVACGGDSSHPVGGEGNGSSGGGASQSGSSGANGSSGGTPGSAPGGGSSGNPMGGGSGVGAGSAGSGDASPPPAAEGGTDTREAGGDSAADGAILQGGVDAGIGGGNGGGNDGGSIAWSFANLVSGNSATKIILFTVPTFNLTGSALNGWRQTNSAIRTSPPAGADRVFDMAAVESQPPPNDGQVQTQYMSSSTDAHPNDLAGTDIANAFLTWYKK